MLSHGIGAAMSDMISIINYAKKKTSHTLYVVAYKTEHSYYD